jgi:hypothetical protein
VIAFEQGDVVRVTLMFSDESGDKRSMIERRLGSMPTAGSGYGSHLWPIAPRAGVVVDSAADANLLAYNP